MDAGNNPYVDDSDFIASTSYMDFLLGFIASAPFFSLFAFGFFHVTLYGIIGC